MCYKDRDSFGEIYNMVYLDVEKIVRRYDGMLLTQQLMDSIKLDIYDYKQSFKHKYCIEEQQLDRVIKSCYRDAVQKLEENSKYDEEVENSFVYQCIGDIIKTKEYNMKSQ